MAEMDYRKIVQLGLIAGVVAVSVCAIGMVETFNNRDIITDVLSLGQLLLYSIPLIAGYAVVKVAANPEIQVVKPGSTLLGGALVGLLTALPVVGLIILETVWPSIRDYLVNVSPALIEFLTFGLVPVVGTIILSVVFTTLGVVGAAYILLPNRFQNPLLSGVIWTCGIGLFAASFATTTVIQLIPRVIVRVLFGTTGISLLAAAIVFILAVVITAWWQARGKERYHGWREAHSEEQQAKLGRTASVIGIALVLLIPLVLGKQWSQVLGTVGIFVMMGFGLNIVVGFAGLLDLGYVAFFAIGAYTVGLLTSTGDLGFGLPFWFALPFSILTAATAGILLGVPVLRMRGDYLAIVTLGFGEIIRVLVISDLLKPIIGGAQGIIKIGRPKFLAYEVVEPEYFYYLILAGCLLALFVSTRLRDSRQGRRWMALREDEDVAEAMGIHLVNTKLLAFSVGAAMAGLAGGIFASRLGSAFPHSFALLISINVLVLIIVGGIGSHPGVVVGALVVIGLPEMLREFTEYRLLIYGALLIVMMLVRPEGLWPSPIRRMELHAEGEIADHEGPHAEQVADLV